MIEILREWKHSWNPIVEALIGYVLFLGGYTLMQVIGSVLADMIEKKKGE